MMLLLKCSVHDFVAARHGVSGCSERGAKSAAISSYNNSNSPRRGTDQLRGDW
jgi:hypothetical protein